MHSKLKIHRDPFGRNSGRDTFQSIDLVTPDAPLSDERTNIFDF